jgi:hypothetical protein
VARTTAQSPQGALANLPSSLRKELLDAFSAIERNFRARRWEPSELNGGKLCEVVYSIVRGHVDGQMPNKASKPQNMVDACRKLERETSLPRSLRIQIPRMVVALYEIRNNRGVGHVGGDVDPNHMDAVTVLAMAKWLVAELVRVFHNVDTATAAAIAEALVEREVPLIWRVGDKERVLNARMTLREKALLHLYSAVGPVSEGDLISWIEPARPADFRRDVLRKGHKERLLEYEAVNGTVEISPAGIRAVEERLDGWERNAR